MPRLGGTSEQLRQDAEEAIENFNVDKQALDQTGAAIRHTHTVTSAAMRHLAAANRELNEAMATLKAEQEKSDQIKGSILAHADFIANLTNSAQTALGDSGSELAESAMLNLRDAEAEAHISASKIVQLTGDMATALKLGNTAQEALGSVASVLAMLNDVAAEMGSKAGEAAGNSQDAARHSQAAEQNLQAYRDA